MDFDFDDVDQKFLANDLRIGMPSKATVVGDFVKISNRTGGKN